MPEIAMLATEQSFDERGFRDALGAFTTGVTVITARDPRGEMVGVTANSFSSLSLDPPLVLWSLRRASNTLAVFRRATHFAVHVLAAEQEALARQFARSAADRFEGLVTRPGLGGAPLLDHTIARFECRRHQEVDGGDHVILIGRVERFHHEPGHAPLVFHRGRMTVLQAS